MDLIIESRSLMSATRQLSAAIVHDSTLDALIAWMRVSADWTYSVEDGCIILRKRSGAGVVTNQETITANLGDLDQLERELSLILPLDSAASDTFA